MGFCVCRGTWCAFLSRRPLPGPEASLHDMLLVGVCMPCMGSRGEVRASSLARADVEGARTERAGTHAGGGSKASPSEPDGNQPVGESI